MKDPLTVKQRGFVEAYLSNGQNGAAAYQAVYGSKGTKQRAAEEACKLLENPKIAPILAAATAKAEAGTARVVEKFAMTKEVIATNLAKLSSYDVRGAFKWDAGGKVTLKASDELPDDLAFAITAIEVRDNGTIKLTFADKRAAHMDLAKLQGHIVDRKDVRKVKSFEDLTDEEVAQLAAEKVER